MYLENKKNYAKRLLAFILILVLAMGLASCSGNDSGDKKEAEKTVAPQNVAALSSSLGEVWLLAGGELSMVTDDFFEERDFGIKEDDVTLIGSVKDPNAELIIENEPDLVILTEDIDSHGKLAANLNEMGIPVYVAKIESFDDYLKTLKDFTEMTGENSLYEKNGTSIESEITNIISKNGNYETTPKALVMRAFSSGVSVLDKEHVVCDILDNLNVENVAAGNSSLKDLSMEAIIEANPDNVFLVTMGNEEDALKYLEENLYADPAWKTLDAVKNNKVIILPKDLFHYKPNVRWAEAYEYIADIIKK